MKFRGVYKEYSPTDGGVNIVSEPLCVCVRVCGDEGQQVSAISPCSPTYPLFTLAVPMVMKERIATWMIGANPRVIGPIMDTHSGK